MDDELTPEQKFAAEDAETKVPRELLQGRSQEEIVADLIKLDWSPAAANAFVARVVDDLRRFQASPESRQRLVAEAWWQFVGGAILALLSVGLTASTFLFALAGSGFFVVAFGLFFGGLILAGRGWARWRLYRGNVLPSGQVDQADEGPA